jgi:hypothetical protein
LAGLGVSLRGKWRGHVETGNWLIRSSVESGDHTEYGEGLLNRRKRRQRRLVGAVILLLLYRLLFKRGT